MENTQIAERFDEMADLLELQDGNPFRVRSYRQAAQSIRGLGRSLEDMVGEDENLEEISGVGESISDKIKSILDRGTFEDLDDARQEVPEGVRKLMAIPNIGPKKATKLHKKLDISDIEDLKAACESEEVQDVEGFGEKTEEKIEKGLKTISRTAGRILWADAREQVDGLREILDDMEQIKRYEVAGSYRRGKETVGDLDILIVADERKDMAEALVDMDKVSETISKGKEKTSVRLDSGLQVDFRFIEEGSFGAALLYFTGSKAHNIALRRRAQEKDWKLSEYALESGDKKLASKTEEAIYKRFGLPWIPPEMRENEGEFDRIEDAGVPKLVEMDHIRGDLHTHTKATDGQASISEMVDAALERGYKYVAITDHSNNVHVASGLDSDELKKHAKIIRKENDKRDDIWVLAGVECDILKDGTLDIDKDVLGDLDWVVASVHYNRDMLHDEMTERILEAVESGLVHCLGHPLGRMIGKRDPLDFDFSKVAKACAKHDVAMEIDAQPDRLDLPDNYIREALKHGCKFSIATDAHSQGEFGAMRNGLNMARRGWLERSDVINTRTKNMLGKWIKKH